MAAARAFVRGPRVPGPREFCLLQPQSLLPHRVEETHGETVVILIISSMHKGTEGGGLIKGGEQHTGWGYSLLSSFIGLALKRFVVQWN